MRPTNDSIVRGVCTVGVASVSFRTLDAIMMILPFGSSDIDTTCTSMLVAEHWFERVFHHSRGSVSRW